MKHLVLAILLLTSCLTITVKPVPVVLSWGGLTPDKNLVDGTAKPPMPAEDPPNFHQVEGGLYRGGEPGVSGWAKLCAISSKWTEIKVSYPDEGTQVKPPCNVKIIAIPIPPKDLFQLFDEPNPADLASIQAAIKDSLTTGYTYENCLHGQDRTGLIMAMYRVLIDHWTPDKAMDEAKSLGYHVELVGLDLAWKKFVKTLPVAK